MDDVDGKIEVFPEYFQAGKASYGCLQTRNPRTDHSLRSCSHSWTVNGVMGAASLLNLFSLPRLPWSSGSDDDDDKIVLTKAEVESLQSEIADTEEREAHLKAQLEHLDELLRSARLSGYLYIRTRWTQLPGEPPIIDDAEVDDWLPRFVVLQGSCIFYYLNSTDLSPQDSTLLSDVVEVGTLPSFIQEDEQKRYAFYILTCHGLRFECSSASKIQVDSWLAALRADCSFESDMTSQDSPLPRESLSVYLVAGISIDTSECKVFLHPHRTILKIRNVLKAVIVPANWNNFFQVGKNGVHRTMSTEKCGPSRRKGTQLGAQNLGNKYNHILKLWMVFTDEMSSQVYRLASRTVRALVAASRSSPLFFEGRTAAAAAITMLGGKVLSVSSYYERADFRNTPSGWVSGLLAIPAAAYMLQDQEAHAAELERTFIAIKPDGVQRGLIAEIISRFERKGYKLVAIKLIVPSKEFAQKHYYDLKDRPFFNGLCDFLSSGPVLAMVWEGEGVIKNGRKLIGATDPQKSEPGTIRGDLAVVVGRNIIHGSDGPETARNEIALWFDPSELVSYTSNAEKWIYGVN
ncbi:uncharacterized protein [Elaeis guineensis]|uniref:uncharacterized protein n=1 Tax=Elaeis guineensis var. tenera TaxID=51953 RepID=UPI003C6CDD33